MISSSYKFSIVPSSIIDDGPMFRRYRIAWRNDNHWGVVSAFLAILILRVQ